MTAKVRQQLLDLNEGFIARTFYEAKNFRESRTYRIVGGELLVRSSGKTSWADSRFDKEFIADPDTVRRFLRKHLDELNIDGAS